MGTPSLASTSSRWSLTPVDRSPSPESIRINKATPSENTSESASSEGDEENSEKLSARTEEMTAFAVDEERTTVMIRNIPNKYPQRKLLQVLFDNGITNFDFFFLPVDFRNKCNVGYGFVNFGDAKSAMRFMEIFVDDLRNGVTPNWQSAFRCLWPEAGFAIRVDETMSFCSRAVSSGDICARTFSCPIPN